MPRPDINGRVLYYNQLAIYMKHFHRYLGKSIYERTLNCIWKTVNKIPQKGQKNQGIVVKDYLCR